jgi:hypothetical protein
MSPWSVIQFVKPLDDWTGARIIVRSEDCPGGIAAIIGGAEEHAGKVAAANEMYETLRTIAGLAVGEGDVCEIIARRARVALAKADYPLLEVQDDGRAKSTN